MLKLMIVEDEENIREGVAALVPWHELGFAPPTMWASAVDALIWLEHERVDLIITDIYMPVLTGLEFARMVKESYPNTEIVILTGHEQFSLAQEAISIGVKGYLLKPVDAEKLCGLLAEIRAELDRKIILGDWIAATKQKLTEYMPIVQERFFRDLITGAITGTDQIMERGKAAGVDLAYNRLQCLALRMLKKEAIAVSEEVALRQIIRELLGKAYVYSLNHEGMELVVTSKMCSDEQLVLLVVSIRENLHLNSCIGIGDIYESLSMVRKSTEEAVRAAKLIRSSERVKILRHRDMVRWMDDSSQYPYEIEKRLFDVVRFREEVDEDVLEEFFRAALPPRHSAENARLIMIQFFAAIHRLAHEYHIKADLVLETIERYADFESLEAYFRHALEQLVQDIRGSHERYVAVMVKQVRQIIEEEYHDPELSVIYLANRLSVTPNYLSRIFSSQTGETCIEYLTRVRMHAAREMLLHSDKKSYLIAYETGYRNPNYFSALFKKTEGISPREFRERNQI